MMESIIPITFLPTGEIDNSTSTQNLTAANNLLAQTINLGRSVTGDPRFDIYRFFNWLYVSSYWILLYDFGETAPTYYNLTSSGTADLSSPLFYPSTNNIFVNQSLFSIYSSYLKNTIVPFLIQLNDIDPIPEFLPLDVNNTLQPINMSFVRSYSCLQRQIKGGLSAVVSIMVADYVFIMGAYRFFVASTGWWNRKSKKGTFPYHRIDKLGNFCKGCVELMREIHPLDNVTDGKRVSSDTTPLLNT
jgi:hypothetical protein